MRQVFNVIFFLLSVYSHFNLVLVGEEVSRLFLRASSGCPVFLCPCVAFFGVYAKNHPEHPDLDPDPDEVKQAEGLKAGPNGREGHPDLQYNPTLACCK